MPIKPISFAANQPKRFYRGGAGIARFRDTEQLYPNTPEDFIASTTEVFGGGGGGLSRLGDGRILRDVINEDPEGFLGPEHVAAYGSDIGLLVKMLDTGERLLAPTPRTLGVSGFLGSCGSCVLCESQSPFPGDVRAWFLPVCRGGVARGSTVRGSRAAGAVFLSS